MKCYFALTEPDQDNEVYIDLLEVALKSATTNTSLDLYALYDGSKESPCYKLLQHYNVTTIFHKFSHEDYLPKVYPKNYLEQKFGKCISYKKIAGSFMRLDIPFVEKEDDFVLYCDIDVFFNKEFCLDDLPHPCYLAAAPEAEKDVANMSYFNAGVLLLNISNMKEKISKIYDCLEKGKRNSSGVFDQGFLNQFCFREMELLPIEFNWKPYWGVNHQAKIVHFHGMKPNGNTANSGFNMEKYVHYATLKDHPQDFEGLVYYSLLFFQTLGKDGNQWISQYLTDVFLSYLHYSQPNNKIITYMDCKNAFKSFITRKLNELKG